jgi:1-aminocyclopropane-1-carboxylate deaminase
MAIRLNLNFDLNWLEDPLLQRNKVKLGVLRLDQLHPIVSGNKWFKLRYFLEEVKKENKEGIITFGGAYSNHLAATAAACAYEDIPVIGFIRGLEGIEKPTATLIQCKEWKMQLAFLTRATYAEKETEKFLQEIASQYPNHLIVPEGGFADKGIEGAAAIHKYIPEEIDIIATPVGSSTTMIGLIEGSKPQQKVIGFTALKQGEYLAATIKAKTKKGHWQLITDYHFGGFGKHRPVLLEFIKKFKKAHGIELDFVYTAKMMAGIFDLIEKEKLKECTICCIHTGGLQGNNSIAHLLV